MNFLAHLYLSPAIPEIRLGGFIADSIKGSQINLYSENIQKGIRLHRQIDSFTDNHPIVKECRKKLSLQFRLYSGVVLDIYYDHFLAKHWDRFATIPLHSFVENQYALIETNSSLLPQKVLHTFAYMKKFNWLENYKDLDFLTKVFNGMSNRTSFVSNMQWAVKELEKDYSFYETSFYNFFPKVCLHFNVTNVEF